MITIFIFEKKTGKYRIKMKTRTLQSRISSLSIVPYPQGNTVQENKNTNKGKALAN